MEELIRLLRENNLMLKFICRYVIEKEQIQDFKDFVNNVTADIYSDYLTKRK